MSAHLAPRRNNVFFTIVVSLFLVLGALLIAVVFVSMGKPMAISIGAVLAVLPVPVLIGAYLWLDRYEPEPRGLLLTALGWGAFVATSSALVVQLLGQALFHRPESFSGVVVAPLTEEAGKGIFILLLLWFRRHELDGVLDGIVYAGMVGIGFAFTENILYLSSAYVGDEQHPGGIGGALTLFVIRCIFSPFAHPLFTAFTGIGVGIAVSTRRTWLKVLAPALGYLVAVSAHAAWNGSAFIGGGTTFLRTYAYLMVPAFLTVIAFAIWSRRQEGRVLSAALEDCARRGLLNPAEIPWLVRLPARRQARAYAMRVGGRPARDVMAEYQRAAVELGFLHSRYLRGTAPADFESRGHVFVSQMAALRPRLVWPGAPAVGVAGRTVAN